MLTVLPFDKLSIAAVQLCNSLCPQGFAPRRNLMADGSRFLIGPKTPLASTATTLRRNLVLFSRLHPRPSRPLRRNLLPHRRECPFPTNRTTLDWAPSLSRIPPQRVFWSAAIRANRCRWPVHAAIPCRKPSRAALILFASCRSFGASFHNALRIERPRSSWSALLRGRHRRILPIESTHAWQ